jgi:NADH dehydrogenase
MGAEVLVLGGGFAGLAAVGELVRRRPRDVSVRLIDSRPASAFSPLLPDLISGRVGPQNVSLPLAPHCSRLGVAFTLARVTGIVPDAVTVETDAGAFTGDGLIVCLGCETNYFGSRDAKAHALGLKSIEEGLAIQRETLRLARSLQGRAGSEPAAAVVVVGGGYTGLEAASHIAYLLHRASGRSYEELQRVCPIVVAEKGDTVLRQCSENIRRQTLRTAAEYGLDVRTNCTVESFSGTDVTLSDGSVMKNAMAVWAAGVSPGEPCSSLPVPKTPGGRLAVDEFLRLPGAPRAFAAGDVAGPIPAGAEEPLRMSVQFALDGGRCAARNALRALAGKALAPFKPRDLGYVVPFAPGRAIGAVLGREMSGRLPFALHYLMCIIRSWSWRGRVGIVSDLVRRRSAR